MRIWTIGHSTLSQEAFLDLLRRHGVRAIADVRRFPGSRRHPQYEAAAMQRWLEAAGLGYRHHPGLGGRRRGRPDSPYRAWRNSSFRAYADHLDTPEFTHGLDQLLVQAAEAPTALLCSEAQWWRCHRMLIADVLKMRGDQVLHILGPRPATEHPWSPAARVTTDGLDYRVEEEGS